MKDIWLWLEKWGMWIGGGIVAFFIWLRFFHDPQVAREAQLEHRKENLKKRKKALERMGKDTEEEESRLREELQEVDDRLKDIRRDTDADAAADRLRERFGWSDESEGG